MYYTTNLYMYIDISVSHILPRKLGKFLDTKHINFSHISRIISSTYKIWEKEPQNEYISIKFILKISLNFLFVIISVKKLFRPTVSVHPYGICTRTFRE